MQAVVFEDRFVSRLQPASRARPAYAITCGGCRLIDWLPRLATTVRGVVRRYLADLQAADFPPLCGGLQAEPTLFVNARLVPARNIVRQVEAACRDGEPFVVRTDETVVAALLPGDAAQRIGRQTGTELGDALLRETAVLPRQGLQFPLLDYPHDIVGRSLEILDDNMQHRLETGDLHEVRDGVFVAEGVQLRDDTATDTADGPLILEAGVSIGPHSYLSGPVWIGRNARIAEHASIKDAVCLGHTTKIGGEVEASVIEPYTNKQHYGFLGHSYLGSWINLGAGTCNSDLKNTYGLVNMHYDGAKVSTGMQFVGCVMGDYAKTAINTGIFTGKTIGVCSMVYGFVTENVPSFVNYARLFGQVAELPAEVMISTQKRMFVRRKVTQREVDRQLICDLFELTRPERAWTDEPAPTL